MTGNAESLTKIYRFLINISIELNASTKKSNTVHQAVFEKRMRSVCYKLHMVSYFQFCDPVLIACLFELLTPI